MLWNSRPTNTLQLGPNALALGPNLFLRLQPAAFF